MVKQKNGLFFPEEVGGVELGYICDRDVFPDPGSVLCESSSRVGVVSETTVRKIVINAISPSRVQQPCQETENMQ
jgi:hypothetical protein